MLQYFRDYDRSLGARLRLEKQLQSHLQTVLDSRGRGDLMQVARAEAEVKRDPRGLIHLDETGRATIAADGRTFQGGRFELVSLGELRRRAVRARAQAIQPQTHLRFWVFDGNSPLTDIGSLQATAPPGSLFQVASQHNCLESPAPFVTDVAHYASDPTQGPRASISAFPGTFVRHYAAPRDDGTRFVQATDREQINLLAAFCRPGVAAVDNGYLLSDKVLDPPALARLLVEQHDAALVGVHDEVEVVLGHDWAGSVEGRRTIAQVFASTVAGGMYSVLDTRDPVWEIICTQLQRAAYLGTLLSAAALGKSQVVLTLIGGGVFRNPVPIIWEALLWALEETAPLLHRDLTVFLNGFSIGKHIPAIDLHAAAQKRGGALVRFDWKGGVVQTDW